MAAGVSLTSPSTLVAQLPAPGSKITKDELEDVSHEAIRVIIIILTRYWFSFITMCAEMFLYGFVYM